MQLYLDDLDIPKPPICPQYNASTEENKIGDITPEIVVQILERRLMKYSEMGIVFVVPLVIYLDEQHKISGHTGLDDLHSYILQINKATSEKFDHSETTFVVLCYHRNSRVTFETESQYSCFLYRTHCYRDYPISVSTIGWSDLSRFDESMSSHVFESMLYKRHSASNKSVGHSGCTKETIFSVAKAIYPDIEKLENAQVPQEHFGKLSCHNLCLQPDRCYHVEKPDEMQAPGVLWASLVYGVETLAPFIVSPMPGAEKHPFPAKILLRDYVQQSIPLPLFSIPSSGIQALYDELRKELHQERVLAKKSEPAACAVDVQSEIRPYIANAGKEVRIGACSDSGPKLSVLAQMRQSFGWR
ncbi:MAG: hypothetical protein V4490_05430 [Pseudomonadota bacterium]